MSRRARLRVPKIFKGATNEHLLSVLQCTHGQKGFDDARWNTVVLNQTLVFHSKSLRAHLLRLVSIIGPMVSSLFVGREGRGGEDISVLLRKEGSVNVQH